MTNTNSSLVTYTKISPNKTSPRNHEIDTITIHCYVGQVTAESGCNGGRFVKNDPVGGASCNYVVGYDGTIGLCVEEKDRSWCSSNKANDHRAITIEVASETVHPYKVTDNAMSALIKLCADICKRNNIKKLVWSTNKNDRVNHLNGCNMTVHMDYKNKACPGQYLYDRHGYIADEVNKLLGVTTPSSTRNYLMKGDKGAEVKTLQENLIYMEYSCGSSGADGDFGSGTDTAVRAFQKDNGLVVDGKYGVSSKAKLEALVSEKKKIAISIPTTSTTYSHTDFIKDVQRAIGTTPDGIVGSKTLAALITVSKTKNNKHAVVKPLQKYLNALGYNAGVADGIAGAKFDSAAKAWAKANGCVADGEFTKGGTSWKKILGVL